MSWSRIAAGPSTCGLGLVRLGYMVLWGMFGPVARSFCPIGRDLDLGVRRPAVLSHRQP